MPPAFNSLISGLTARRAASTRRLAEVVLAILVTVQSVRLGVILLRPDPPTAGGLRLAAQPVDTTILARFDPFNRPDAVQGPAGAGASGLKLFGVRTGPAGGAIIAGPDGVQKSYALGQEVQPGLTLTGVADDHVVLNRAGVGSRLYFETQTPGVTLSPPPPQAADMVQLGRQVGLHSVPGGFAITPRGGGVLLAMAGLRAGDIVTALDGRPLASDTAGDLAAQLAGRSSAQVTILRDGRRQTVTLQVPRP